MRKMTLGIISIAVATSLFCGCAVKSGNEKLEDSSSASINEFIKKDITTKEEVKAKLGEPSSVDITSIGEKWQYEHIRKNAKLVNFVPVVNWFVEGTNDTKKTLVILFDGDIVKNYSVAVAEGETKGGLLQ